MVIATGIANIWVRDPFATLAAQLTLADPERFLRGLGVSHGRTVEGKRGRRYRKPFTSMRTFLGADHLCIQVFDADPHGLPMRQWKELATALR
jgi:hypothetical protein